MPDISNSQITDKITSFTERCVPICLPEHLLHKKKHPVCIKLRINCFFL